jgi:hypothetical protein
MTPAWAPGANRKGRYAPLRALTSRLGASRLLALRPRLLWETFMVRSAPRSARVPLETKAVVRMSAAFECYCAAFAAECFPTPSWDKHAFYRFAVAPALSPTACKSGCIHQAT